MDKKIIGIWTGLIIVAIIGIANSANVNIVPFPISMNISAYVGYLFTNLDFTGTTGFSDLYDNVSVTVSNVTYVSDEIYINNIESNFTLNETQLNATIEALSDIDTDTDNNKTTDGVYLYENDTHYLFNETQLNATIEALSDIDTDTNCSVDGSCLLITYDSESINASRIANSTWISGYSNCSADNSCSLITYDSENISDDRLEDSIDRSEFKASTLIETPIIRAVGGSVLALQQGADFFTLFSMPDGELQIASNYTPDFNTTIEIGGQFLRLYSGVPIENIDSYNYNRTKNASIYIYGNGDSATPQLNFLELTDRGSDGADITTGAGRILIDADSDSVLFGDNDISDITNANATNFYQDGNAVIDVSYTNITYNSDNINASRIDNETWILNSDLPLNQKVTIDANNITSGTIAYARLAYPMNQMVTIAGENVTAGTIADARLEATIDRTSFVASTDIDTPLIKNSGVIYVNPSGDTNDGFSFQTSGGYPILGVTGGNVLNIAGDTSTGAALYLANSTFTDYFGVYSDAGGNAIIIGEKNLTLNSAGSGNIFIGSSDAVIFAGALSGITTLTTTGNVNFASFNISINSTEVDMDVGTKNWCIGNC